jgi:hypothetical protein
MTTNARQKYLADGEPLRLVWPQRKMLTEGEQSMLDDWSLTLSRVRDFAEPFYFDLGLPAAKPLSDIEAGVSLAVHSWSSYYPFVPVLLRGNEHYLLGVRVFDISMSNLSIFKSRLLEQLFESSRRGIRAKTGRAALNPADSRKLTGLRKKANRLAERRAAGILRENGWLAEEGFTLKDPVDPRTREEIDLIAIKEFGNRVFVCLGEVKDFDLALHRTAARRNFESRIAGATAQVERKTAFIERVWRSILSERFKLDPDSMESVELLSLVITSESLPLGFFNRCATLCETDLATLADHLGQDADPIRQTLAKGWKTLK